MFSISVKKRFSLIKLHDVSCFTKFLLQIFFEFFSKRLYNYLMKKARCYFALQYRYPSSFGLHEGNTITSLHSQGIGAQDPRDVKICKYVVTPNLKP